MTQEEFTAKMREIFKRPYDEEYAHCAADDLMCKLLTELGYQEGVRIFMDADKWYA